MLNKASNVLIHIYFSQFNVAVVKKLLYLYVLWSNGPYFMPAIFHEINNLTAEEMPFT
jgi:hypothetical protein